MKRLSSTNPNRMLHSIQATSAYRIPEIIHKLNKVQAMVASCPSCACLLLESKHTPFTRALSVLVIDIKWIFHYSSGHHQSSSSILRVLSEGNAGIRYDSLVGLLQSHPPCDAVLLLQLQSPVELWHPERADLLPHSTDLKHLQLILQTLAQEKLLHCLLVKWSCFFAQPL